MFLHHPRHSNRHFDIQRVLDHLKKNYWWRWTGNTAIGVVKVCLSRARVKELQPLPIEGLRYRWGVDFGGPLPKTTASNEWVVVCVEHFTKWVELITLTWKSSHDSARGFLEGVLSRYGALGEVLTYQGREFLGEFQK